MKKHASKKHLRGCYRQVRSKPAYSFVDLAMRAHVRNRTDPPADIIAMSRQAMKSRVEECARTGNIRPILTYHGINYREEPDGRVIPLPGDYSTFIWNSEAELLARAGMDITIDSGIMWRQK